MNNTPMISMFIQFQMDDNSMDIDDPIFAEKMERNLEDMLQFTDNGNIIGRDFGAGTVNIFFEALDRDQAVETIVTGLKLIDHEGVYLIATKKGAFNDKLDITGSTEVLFPKEYTGSVYF